PARVPSSCTSTAWTPLTSWRPPRSSWHKAFWLRFNLGTIPILGNEKSRGAFHLEAPRLCVWRRQGKKLEEL
ncbi:MAG: hypothetical protein ACLTYW_02895, partial [Collinsella sp.]